MSRGQFSHVGAARVTRSRQRLPHTVKTTVRMGDIVPILAKEAYPSDVWRISGKHLVRFLALLAPVMHEVNIKVDYFFVPWRILWKDWEKYITGGRDGKDESVLPRWQPQTDSGAPADGNPQGTGKYTLWDYFGLPLNWKSDPMNPTTMVPHDLYRRAYNLVYDDWYRDDQIEPPLYPNGIDDMETVLSDKVQRCSYPKDYFTSARLDQQLGDPPAIPILGTAPVVFPEDVPVISVVNTGDRDRAFVGDENPNNVNDRFIANGTPGVYYVKGQGFYAAKDDIDGHAGLNRGTVTLSSGASFDIAAFRLAFAVQRVQERNSRSGARYIEWLISHFRDSPRDERLQRPEYIGGYRSHVIFSEVLQTSDANTEDSPLATMAGHGISYGNQRVSSYHCHEMGCILGLMRIVPKAMYFQGIERQWTRRSKFDWFLPELQNLSEQAVTESEIYATGNNENDSRIFGYAPRYAELRYAPSYVTGDMRDTLEFWHLGRRYASAPALNPDFLHVSNINRIFAVTNEDMPGMPGNPQNDTARNILVQWAHDITVSRPMSAFAEPGLIDHV